MDVGEVVEGVERLKQEMEGEAEASRDSGLL